MAVLVRVAVLVERDAIFAALAGDDDRSQASAISALVGESAARRSGGSGAGKQGGGERKGAKSLVMPSGTIVNDSHSQ